MQPTHILTLPTFSLRDRIVGEWMPVAPCDGREACSAQWFLLGRCRGGKAVSIIPICVRPFVIGRVGGVDLALPSPIVSRRHAEILVLEQKLEVCDLSSRNGTFVNGQKVEGSMIVESDAALQIADVPLHIRYRP